MFQSTLSMKRATYSSGVLINRILVSIHALNEESDLVRDKDNPEDVLFQSTLSMKRATYFSNIITMPFWFQSTLSMKRATRQRRIWFELLRVSIHALNEESDANACAGSASSMMFQSTLSMKRATRCAGRVVLRLGVSIHALNEESDL